MENFFPGTISQMYGLCEAKQHPRHLVGVNHRIAARRRLLHEEIPESGASRYYTCAFTVMTIFLEQNIAFVG